MKTKNEVIELIKSANGDLSILNQAIEKGFTPLHCMIEHQEFKWINYLLELGVNINLKTEKGHNALELSQSLANFFKAMTQKSIVKKYDEITQILIHHQAQKEKEKLEQLIPNKDNATTHIKL